MTRFYRCLGEDDHMGDGYDVRGNDGKHDMEDLMFGIGTNCITAAVILWETTDLQWFPATLAITAAAAFLIGARELVKKK